MRSNIWAWRVRNGLNQQFGVRSIEVLCGTGVALTAHSVKILALNPPTADILVEGVIRNEEGTEEPHREQRTVDIDKLVPLDKPESKDNQCPLLMGHDSSSMPVADPLGLEQCIKLLLTEAIHVHSHTQLRRIC